MAPWALAALRMLATTSVRRLVSRSVPVMALVMLARVRPVTRFLPTLAVTLSRGLTVYGDERALVVFKKNIIMKDPTLSLLAAK